MKKIVIIGASGHGKVVADIAQKNHYDKIVFLDDNFQLKECEGFPVCGTVEDIQQYTSWDFVVAIGDANARANIFCILEEHGCNIVSLIHPEAAVAEDVVIGKGTVVMAGAVINPGAVIGKGCIINTCSSVDHDCKIGDFVHVAVGSHLCGTVTVGDKTWIGAGAVMVNNLSICDNCMVGAGATVIDNIVHSGTYIGTPAKMLKKVAIV